MTRPRRSGEILSFYNSPSLVALTSTSRSAGLNELLTSYVSNHYNDGVSTVYALEDPNYPAPEPVVPEPEPAVAEEEEAPAPVVATEETEAKAETEGDEVKESPAEGEDDAEKIVEDTPEPAAAPVEEAEETKEVEAPAPPAPVARPSRVFGLYFVGNKYNSNNYWCVSSLSLPPPHQRVLSRPSPSQDRTMAFNLHPRSRGPNPHRNKQDQHPLLRTRQRPTHHIPLLHLPSPIHHPFLSRSDRTHQIVRIKLFFSVE